ncbi:MAG: DinB family protein [Pirellulales bacterium]
MSLAELALAQIVSARQYLQTLLADLPDDEWFVMPTGAATHVAWQVGHLAMAEYGLCLFRQRGRTAADLELMPGTFRKQFQRGSQPQPDPQQNPTPAEIRQALDTVHSQVLAEVPTFTDEQLSQPADMPYAAQPTRYGALLFCAHHEMLHAGQIGLLRRLLGHPPVR